MSAINSLQWIGMLLIVLAYWFYVTRTVFAASVTIIGCLLILIWAILLSAYAIAILEAFVIGISIRNILAARRA